MPDFKELKPSLDKERSVLIALVYRSKNQHKSSLVLRKMIHLKRLLRITGLSETKKQDIIKCTKSLYIVSSSDLSMGFFIPLNLCVMGICARVFYLISKCKVDSGRNKIDEMFAVLD